MLKIEEGMYVRTEKGEIKKVFQYNKQEDNLMWCTLNCHATIKSSIVKASYNIIDLIEAGDYVNGQLVYYDEESECLGQNFVDADSNYYFESITKGGDYKIKTILTKEQYENNCYRIDE